MKKIIIWLIAMTCVHWAHGQQTVTGYVYGLSGKQKIPLEGATVTENNCPNGTIVGRIRPVARRALLHAGYDTWLLKKVSGLQMPKIM